MVIVGFVARRWQKLNYAELCGLLAGSMTDPPALAFAQQTIVDEDARQLLADRLMQQRCRDR